LVKEFLENSKGSRKPNNKVGRRTHTTTKRKKKRYLYARTQEFYKKDPGTLARYIREGIPWPDDREAIFPLEVVKQFSTDLWGTEPEVTIPFNRPSTNDDEV